MQEKNPKERRGKQVLVGASIMLVITVLVVGFLIGWRLVPGWVGESLGMVAGVMSTPFFMETSFVLIGFVVVVGLNVWRRRKDIDEFVEIEIGDDDRAGKSD